MTSLACTFASALVLAHCSSQRRNRRSSAVECKATVGCVGASGSRLPRRARVQNQRASPNAACCSTSFLYLKYVNIREQRVSPDDSWGTHIFPLSQVNRRFRSFLCIPGDISGASATAPRLAVLEDPEVRGVPTTRIV